MGARFGLEGWPEKVVHRDLRKVPKNSAPEPRGLEVIPPAKSRQLRLYNVSDSRQLRLLLIDELLLIVGLERGAWRSSIHSMSHASLKPAQGKLCPLGARGLAVNSLFRDVVHLVLDLTEVPEPFLKAFDFRLLHRGS